MIESFKIENSSPLLSICVPTYNRYKTLDALLSSLVAIKEKYADEIEICISNNASNDLTADIVHKYEKVLSLNKKTQIKNIGATLNILSVVSSINGKWGILIGDDDAILVEGVDYLISMLRQANANTWFLVEASTPFCDGYFSRITGDSYSARNFQRVLLKGGLNPYGFMGTHVFPQSSIHEFAKLNILNAQPWPHVAAFVRCLIGFNMQICIIRQKVVVQAHAGTNLFIESGDWARFKMDKVKILKLSYKDLKIEYIFFLRAMLKELYCRSSIVSLLLWKLQEPDDFSQNSFIDSSKMYEHFKEVYFFIVPHYIFMMILRAIPNNYYVQLMKFLGKRQLYQDYIENKTLYGKHNGVTRGI